ncbi:MFS transporter [Paenarthrobacter sp. NPDC092416]|uniref:MFS transporter n=1 Tax=Paenarthrobacter sp. NPDC092416 TaxID=3364386 RepID=UPI003828DED6
MKPYEASDKGARGTYRRRFLTSSAISIIGDGATLAVMALASSIAGYSIVETGWILAASAVPKCAVVLWGGIAGDRYERRTLLILAYVIAGLAQIFSGAILLFQGPTLLLILAQIIFGSAVAVSRPASTAYLPSVATADELASANSALTTASSVASTVGPLIGAVFVMLEIAPWALVADGFSFIVASVLLMGLPASQGAISKATSTWTAVRSGAKELMAVPWLVSEMCASAILLFMVTGPFLVLGPAAAAALGFPSLWPIALAVFGIGQIFGAVLGGRVRHEAPVLKWASYGVVALALPPICLILQWHPAWFVFAEAGTGVALGFYQVTVTTAMQRAVAPGSLARVASLNAFISFSLLPASFIIAPIVASAVGVTAVFVVSVVGTVITMVLLLLSPAVRRYRWRPAQIPALKV